MSGARRAIGSVTPAHALCLLVAACAIATRPAAAQTALAGDTIEIHRAAGPITIDGDLSDPGWRGAARIDRWYETQPGDNTPPPVRNVGYLAYDDHAFYAAFEFEDPNPSTMRAPYADRDNIGNGTNDYGGVLLDPRNTGSTGAFFVVTPRNVQYDSITDDASGENASPDFFWDSATKIGPHGWTLEIRIPFSSLRYRHIDPQTWRILLYRNYPRDHHYQFFSAKLPRDGNCLVCRANVLTGLERLPSGGHLVVAPYGSASDAAARGDGHGDRIEAKPVDWRAGVDVKYLPNADNAIDATVKPDFSQVEADTAQIATNQRFALFYAEKRPFFLEGADLLATPIQAVYTRTIAAPDAGVRATGKAAGLRYTVLVADDSGGGSAVLPAATHSSLAPVDFGSTVAIARVKRDIGLSFVGALVTDRESRGGNGHNRVAGPDFQWRPTGSDSFSGQWLASTSQTPNRPDLAAEWTGETFNGHATTVQWSHDTKHLDWYAAYHDASDGFRADVGFVPQVGFRDVTLQPGWTVHPTGAVSRVRTFIVLDRTTDTNGTLTFSDVEPGIGMDTTLNGFVQLRAASNQIRTPAGVLITRRQFGYVAQLAPSPWLPFISVDGTVGQDIDFQDSRPGRGATTNINATIDPTPHLEVALVESVQWLNVDDRSGASRHLFTSQVSRLRGTYTFTSRTFVRVIGQYVSTSSDPALYAEPTDARSGTFSGSFLFAYKINWQSVFYAGYGDDRDLSPLHRLVPSDRQAFVKVSYAFQR